MTDTSHIQALRAVVEHRHLRSAARELHMAPRTVERHIKALEQEIGAELLVHEGREIVATLAARTFLRGTQSVTPIIEQAARAARTAASTGTARLRIGHNGVTGAALLENVLPRLEEVDPPIYVTLYEGSNADLLSHLTINDIDLAIARPPIDEDRLSHELLAHERLDVVVPYGHPLADRRAVTISDLRDETIIIPPREQSPRAHDLLIELCEQEGGFQPEHTEHASSIIGVLILVNARAGVSFLPRHWEIFYRSSRTRTIPLDNPNAALPLHLAWRKHDRTPAINTVRTALLNTAKAGTPLEQRRTRVSGSRQGSPRRPPRHG